MKTLSSDTTPEAEAVLIALYERMTVGQRLQRVYDLNRLARGLAYSDVRRAHPDADEHEVKMRVASRFIEPDLMLKAYGWDPRLEGY